jgi:hypothetical protein
MNKVLVKEIVVPIGERHENRIVERFFRFAIIKKKGVLHFESELPFKKCSYCDKISFHSQEIADLYAYYMKEKYGRYLRSYFSDCNFIYHLTSQ